MKALEIPGKLGGIYAFLVAVFGYFAIQYNNYKIRLDIADSIYKLHDPANPANPTSPTSPDSNDRKRKENQTEDVHPRLSMQQMGKLEIEYPPKGGKLLSKEDQEKKYERILAKFSKFISEEKIRNDIKLFFRTLFSNLFSCCQCCCFRRRKGGPVYILEQVDEKLRTDLDAIEILRRLQELEKAERSVY